MTPFSDGPSSIQPYLILINQLFDLERRLRNIPDASRMGRNVRRMRDALQELGFTWHDPTGEAYDETRTDCEASISGEATGNLLIQETLKPVIHQHQDGHPHLVQRAVVLVAGG